MKTQSTLRTEPVYFLATAPRKAYNMFNAMRNILLLPFLLLLMSTPSFAQTVIQVGTGVVTVTGTSAGTTAVNASPYGVCVGSGNGGKHLQILYLATQINAALTAAGLTTGVPYVISTASWDVCTSVGTATCKNQVGTTIKMKNTAAASLAFGSPQTGLTTVFGPTAITFPNSTGYNVTNTLATNFTWDGTSNLVVEYCYTFTGVGIITAYGGCRRTNVGVVQMIHNGGAAVTCASTFTTNVSAIPNVKFTVSSACTQPTTSATAYSTGSISVGSPGPNSSASFSFTRGSGTGGVIAIAKATTATGSPSTGTVYTGASTVYGSGTAVGTGFLVYASTTPGDNSTVVTVPLTGLTNGVTYNISVFEYNATSTCYQGAATAGTIVVPTCVPPTTPASGINFGNLLSTSNDVNWVRGNGDAGVIVVARLTSTAAVAPTNGSSYAANSVFGSGATTGAGNYVVYSGTGTTVNVSNLTPSTGYTYSVYEYNSAGSCYQSAATLAQTTASCSPASNATSLTYSAITNNAMTATWVRGSGTNVLVVARLTATARVFPTYNATYTTNTAFGAGTGSAITGTGNFVVYNGTGTTVNVTGMANLTGYTFDIYEYNATPNCYWFATPLTAAQSTLDGTTSGGCAATVVRTGTVMTAITPTTVLQSGNITNTNYTSQPIGFTFNYGGTNYTTFGLNTNGYIWFGTGTPLATATNPLSNASANLGGSGTIDGIISAMGAFINSNFVSSSVTPTIGYTVTGVAPNRILTIQWIGYTCTNDNTCSYFLGGNNNDRQDFQIKLNENGGTLSNQIVLAYGDETPYCIAGVASAQVGIRGATNATFTNRTSNTNNWGNNAGGVNTATCGVTGSVYITGATITFTQAVTAGPSVGVGSLNCPAGTVSLTAGAGFTSYQWFDVGTGLVIPGPGSNSSIYTTSATGNYSVVGKNGTCYAQSSATPVTVGGCGFAITASAGANGTISPSGSVNVTSGADQTFTIAGTAPCYQVADVLVDGISVGAVSTYTFTNVTAAHTISATYIINSPSTITATAGANGTISPSGATSVACGSSQNYVINAAFGYQVLDVLVDGISVGVVGSYNFTNVSSNHTIDVSFTPITITTSALIPNFICPGGSVSVPYTISNPISSIAFKAQLSDASGVFANTTSNIIGTLNTTTSGTISATIPTSTPNGSGYRIRVLTTTPLILGSDNTQDIRIKYNTVTSIAGFSSENMGTVGGTTVIATHEAANGFVNTAQTMSGTGDLRNTTNSTGYAGASGGANVFLTNTAGLYFQINGINTLAYNTVSLTFGVYKSLAGETGSTLGLAVSSDGTTFSTPMPLTGLITGAAGWYLVRVVGAIPSSATAAVKFVQLSTASQFRIDDVNIYYGTPTVPSITPSAPAAQCGGTVTLTASPNSTDGASLSWSDASTGNTLVASATGNYSATITDGFGCVANVGPVAVAITVPLVPSVSIANSSTYVCTGVANTFSSSVLNGGTPTYQWYNNGSSIPGATNNTYTPAANTLSNGDAITLSVTSSGSCLTTPTATSNQLTAQKLAYSPTTVWTETFGTNTTTNVAAYASYSNGQGFTFAGSPGGYPEIRTSQPSPTGSGASGGSNMFFATIGSAGGPVVLTISGINTTSAFPNNLSFWVWNDGFALSNSSSFKMEYSTDGTNYFPITYGPTSATLNWYFITINNALPKASNVRLRFTQSGSIQARLDDIKLQAYTTGDASVSPSGPIDICSGATQTLNATPNPGSGITYLWNNAATTAGIGVTTGSNYIVTLTDVFGCKSSASTVVNIIPTVGTPSAISVSAGTEPVCHLTNGTTTTTYSTTASNSTGFNWTLSNNAAGSIDAGGVMTWANGFDGTVDIRVTASGCNGPSAQVVRTVTVNPTPTFTRTFTNVTCYGAANGQIDITTLVGSAPFTYSLDAGTSYPYNLPTISSLSPATYQVKVKDVNGCESATSNVIITQPAAALSVTATNGSPYSTTVTASLFSNPTGGTAPYTYAWSGPGFTSSLQNPTRAFTLVTMTGTYTVTVTDANGCTATASTVMNVYDGYVWTGAVSGDWANNGNWSFQVPDYPDDCTQRSYIQAGTPFSPTVNIAGLTVGNITLVNGAVLTLANDLTLCGNLTGSGTTLYSGVAGPGKLIMKSTPSVLQTISGKTRFVGALRIDNSAGVRVNYGSTQVVNALELKTGVLTVTNSGFMTFISTSSSQCAIIDNFSAGMTGSISGAVVMQRKYDAPTAPFYKTQHYMGSPVDQPLLTQFGANGTPGYIINTTCNERASSPGSPFGDVAQYDEDHGAACTLQGWKIMNAGSAVNGRGYSVSKNGAGTLSLTGVPNQATSYARTGLTNSNWSNSTLQGYLDVSGWHMMSNPWLANLRITTNGGAGIDNQVAVWQTTGGFAGTFAYYQVGFDNVDIAPFQAFLVHKTSPGGTASYTISGSDRVRTPATIQFQSLTNDHELSVYVDNDANGLRDKTIVAFNASATDGFDPIYDGNKLGGDPNRLSLYSMNNSLPMARNTLTSINNTSTVDMNFDAGTSGTFTMSFDGLNSFDPTSYIMLEDKKTNTMYNVRNGNYTFTGDTADSKNRFVLHFTPAAEITQTDATCSTTGTINVTQPGTANWNYTVTDNSNVTVSSGILNQITPIAVNANPGVYTITLVDNNNYTVAKQVQVTGMQQVVASFNTTATTVQQDDEVTFTATSANATNHVWNFGDNSSATGTTITHSYTAPGVYTAKLTSDNNDCQSISTQQITVTAKTATGISTITDNKGIAIWSSENTVYVDMSRETKVEAQIEIYNVLGQQLSIEKFGRSSIYSKQFTNLEAAYVIVRVKNNNEIVTKKVFVANSK